MGIQTIARGSGVGSVLTNPLTATVGVAFPNATVTMKDPVTAINGEAIAWASLQNVPFTLRASGIFFCNSGTTPTLTIQLYCQGVTGTRIATTGAVAVGNTQPSSGSWYLEGRYIWDAASGLNGMYWGFIAGQNSILTTPSNAFSYVGNVSAPRYPDNVTFTPTALFSATGAVNTATLTSLVIDYV